MDRMIVQKNVRWNVRTIERYEWENDERTTEWEQKNDSQNDRARMREH